MSDSPLPQPKKPTKFTPASLRIMQMCQKAFASNNFLLLYFSNRKTFTQNFNDPAFKDALKNKFQFLQLSRADRAGNWLTTSFHVKSSPYYTIINPSNGQFLTIVYGDLSISALHSWLQHFLSGAPKFALSQTIFSELIDDAQKIKLKNLFSYGTKILVNFVSRAMDEKIVYVNRVAPLELAFEKYCGEKGIDMSAHYFLFKGVELPGSMRASQFGLHNGSVVHVHPLEDKTSTEPITVLVVSVDGSSAMFNVTRGKKLGVFLKSYCEMTGLNAAQLRFTFNNEMVNDDLTFAEHNMKDGDQLYAHMKPYVPPTEFVYHIMNHGEIGPIPTMQLQQEQYEMPMTNPNFMFLHSQAQVTRASPLPPPVFAPQLYGQPQTPFPMAPDPKGVHYLGTKGHETNPGASIWENFEIP
jgi:hypothetical protein